MTLVTCPRCDAPSAEPLCPVCRYPVVPERVRELRKPGEYGESLLEFERAKQINVARRHRAFCRGFLAYLLVSLALFGVSAWMATLTEANPDGLSITAALAFGAGFLVLAAVSLFLFIALLRLLGSLELGVFLPLALFLVLFFNQGSIFLGMLGISEEVTDVWILFPVFSQGMARFELSRQKPDLPAQFPRKQAAPLLQSRFQGQIQARQRGNLIAKADQSGRLGHD